MSENGRVPAWLAALGIKEGEYFVDSKLRAKRAMKCPRISPAGRLYIYYGLCTMGFQQELAVKMEAGKKVPITPADACAATGIKRANWRRHHDELEAYGLAKAEGSTKGRILIYAWAAPRDVDLKKIVIAPDDNFFAADHPLSAILRRYKIRFSRDFVIAPDDISELERLARMTKEAELSLRAYADCLRARGRIYKEERNEINIERNSPSSSSAVEVTTSEQPKAEEEEERPYDQFKKLYPPDHFNEAEAKPSFEGLKPEDKRRCLERLNQYLACERWKDEDGRWIPLASTWLKKWDADPPPLIRKKAAASAEGSSMFREMASRLYEERKRGGS